MKIKEEKIKANKLNKSMDEMSLYNENDSKYIVNNEIKDKKMTQKEINDYYKNQFEWKYKKNEKVSDYGVIKTEIEDKEYKSYFHPKLSRGTQEIIIAMNEAKENHLNETMESNYNKIRNNNYFFTDATPNQKYLNYNNNVFSRLHENKKIERFNKYQLFFQPITNKNRNKKILSKYQYIDKYSIDLKKIKLKNENNDKKDENNQFEPWKYYLLRLKKNNSCEYSYKLNVRQSSAWNENDVNIVPYKGESREIIKNFL